MDVAYNDYIKTEAWRKRAEEAKTRVGHRCQICNRAAPRVTLTVHHRTFERLGQEQPEDLTVLCRSCYELYDKNRRMPGPSQSASPTAKTDKPAKQRQPPLTPPPLLFAPARASKKRVALNGQNGHNGPSDELLLPLAHDPIYLLTTEAQSPEEVSLFDLSTTATDSPTAEIYQLSATPEEKPAPQPVVSPPIRQYHRWRLGLVAASGLAILIIFGLLDFAPDLPALFPQRTASTPVTATVVNPVPVIVVDVATAVATVTAASVAAPTAAPLMTPTPLPPTPTQAPPTVAPTPTTVLPTVEPAPQSSVLRTALVCQNPCSCAPIVRTVAQGTPVTVLQTQACGGDIWYQIAENEWLGPGVVDMK